MIDLYIKDIRNCLENKCYFAALSLTLTLPDICGMIEYPDETSVTKRYINWYDKYIGDQLKNQRFDKSESYISGEIVYNLRNQFLHQGNPNIDREKVKEEVNRIDRFILELGDEIAVQECRGVFEAGNASFRSAYLNIAHLCESVCLTAEWYYSINKDKFKDKFPFTFKNIFDNQSYVIINQNSLSIADVIYSRLRESDERFEALDMPKEQFEKQFEAKIVNMLANMVAGIIKGLEASPSHVSQNIPPEKETPQEAPPKKEAPSVQKTDPKKKRENQIRTFFGQNFKDKKYTDHKEEIIKIILNAKTRQQINNALQKIFSGSQVKHINSVIKPLIKDLPGS